MKEFHRDMRSGKIWADIEKHGYTVKFVSHEKIKDYVACYRVIYDGNEIYPPPAIRLGIPVGEIWISDAFEDFADCILFHEMTEIKYRSEGYDGDEAHLHALLDEEKECMENERWKKLKREINVCTHEILMDTPGIGGLLADRIMDNRPYDSMDELLRVGGIGKKRYESLRKNFWCILEG